MRADTHTLRLRARRMSPARLALRWLLVAAVGLLVLAGVVGIVFAGSPARLAEGVTVGGVDVGGLTTSQATRVLEARAERLDDVPIVFTAGAQRFRIAPDRLGVRADWSAAVAAAQNEGAGLLPVRGFKRLHVRVFGSEVEPPVRVYTAALDYKIGQLAKAIDRRHVEASVVRRGLNVEVLPSQSGQRLDHRKAGPVIVRALASLERGTPVALPVRIDPAEVTAADLRRAARQARAALSAPVRVAYGETRWRLPRWRIAELLSLPSAGATRVAIAGPGADRYFGRLKREVDRRPRDAGFAVTSSGAIEIVPAADGLEVDVPSTAKALLAAAVSPRNRTAPLAVVTTKPERSNAEARAMGITGVVGSYTTTYGGTPGRLHNVQLVAQLIDGALIAPGTTFSFNGTTGQRTQEQGFQEAPVIINGELKNGIGGGVCQVSTTVFNAAYEAGLQIDQRTNHALYISHYPTGRDATVNYPDLDLKFTNDTRHWLLLRTFAGAGSLTVNLYGTPQSRRVESETGELVTTGETPVKRISDADMFEGETAVDLVGSPPRETSVTRRVYLTNGTLLHENTWNSSYEGEPTVIRVGTKERPKPPPKPPKAEETKPKPPAEETPQAPTTQQPPQTGTPPAPATADATPAEPTPIVP
jgi:vancomycin resistance protein YoaR